MTVSNDHLSTSSPSAIVAWNGSAESRSALLWALERASPDSGSLTLLTVINEAFRSCGTDAMDELAVIARRALRAEVGWLRSVAPTVHVTARVLTGDPEEQLLEHCPPGSLLVMGRRQHGAAGERGSLATRLCGTVPVPVVLVAEGAESVHTDVVVGVDGSAASSQAVLVAAAEARIRHSALRLVHAWPGMVDGVLREGGGSGEDVHRQLLEAAVDVVRAASAGLAGDVLEVQGVLESGSAEAVLQRHAQTAALLVVGSRGMARSNDCCSDRSAGAC